jgi:hypothetical protein
LANRAKCGDTTGRRRAETEKGNILDMLRQIEGACLEYENAVAVRLPIPLE